MKNLAITYFFRLPDGTHEVFKLELDPRTLELVGGRPAELPAWTRLEFHKCPNCPLSEQTDPYCPLATSLVSIVKRFDGILSYDQVHVDVITEERVTSQETSAQRGISSFMGLVMAASGCPRTAFFRPMARFHLPLSSVEETIYRASSMYLLAQYFLRKEGLEADMEMDGLSDIYNNVQTVNYAILNRLRSITETDSSVNAVMVLDIYARTMELVIKQSLERIRYLFDPYFAWARRVPDPPGDSA